MVQVGYHHANMMANQICADMVVQNNEMLAMMHNISITDRGEETNSSDNTPPPPPTQPAANTATQDSVQLEILRILRAMQVDMNRCR